jgi:hypothetical protein
MNRAEKHECSCSHNGRGDSKSMEDGMGTKIESRRVASELAFNSTGQTLENALPESANCWWLADAQRSRLNEPFWDQGSSPMVHKRFDGSREQYMTGLGTDVAEGLMAIPWVLEHPVMATASTDGAPDVDLLVQIRLNHSLTQAAAYDASNSPTVLASRLKNNTIDIALARIAMAYASLETNSLVTATRTSMNESNWQLQSSAFSVIRALNLAFAQGTAAETPVPLFRGLAQMCNVFGRTQATTGDLVDDVLLLTEKITPNGIGGGEGIDCFLGGK